MITEQQRVLMSYLIKQREEVPDALMLGAYFLRKLVRKELPKDVLDAYLDMTGTEVDQVVSETNLMATTQI